MIIQPKIRGFICTTAHPTGCAKNVQDQIDYVKKHGLITKGPKRVLVVGASTGYGLASRIVAAFGCGAATIGVFFEKEAEDKRTASAGWYNSVAFEQKARKAGLYAKSLNADAFTDEAKDKIVEWIKTDLGQVDLVVYSVAAPRRQQFGEDPIHLHHVPRIEAHGQIEPVFAARQALEVLHRVALVDLFEPPIQLRLQLLHAHDVSLRATRSMPRSTVG